MAVATSSSREYAMGNLIRAGIDSYFDSVVCGDMVKKAKPDPEIIRKHVKVWEYSRNIVWRLKMRREESCPHIRPGCM